MDYGHKFQRMKAIKRSQPNHLDFFPKKMSINHKISTLSRTSTKGQPIATQIVTTSSSTTVHRQRSLMNGTLATTRSQPVAVRRFLLELVISTTKASSQKGTFHIQSQTTHQHLAKDTKVRPQITHYTQLNIDQVSITPPHMHGRAHTQTSNHRRLSALAIPDDERNVTLDRGHGAFVQVGTWDEAQSDSMMVIDPLGRAYTLSGGPVTLDKLGYDPAEAPLVPDEWTGLFDEGVDLSTSAALCPPANQPGEPQASKDCRALPS